MLRIIGGAIQAGLQRSIIKNTENVSSKCCNLMPKFVEQLRPFSILATRINNSPFPEYNKISPLNSPTTNNLLTPGQLTQVPIRTVIKFSKTKGKKKSVKVVLKCFKRLHWGGWIRTIAGRHKRLWCRSAAQKTRYEQHVFCNATQSNLLDKMVTSFWRRPKYYVDDPYTPYHTRTYPRANRRPKDFD